jgi:hypothetical protein
MDIVIHISYSRAAYVDEKEIVDISLSECFVPLDKNRMAHLIFVRSPMNETRGFPWQDSQTPLLL